LTVKHERAGQFVLAVAVHRRAYNSWATTDAIWRP
jgi:hypothetical protein